MGYQTIKAGSGIIAACQSGNRDTEVFTDADKFDMHRKFNPTDSLGFGYGEHRCVAEWLAKAELEIVFGRLHNESYIPFLSPAMLIIAFNQRQYFKDCQILD